MRTILVALALLNGQPLSGQVYASLPSAPTPGLVRVADAAAKDTTAKGDLHGEIMQMCHAMNAKQEGIFHEDISSTVAKYFPVGQPFAETKAIVAQQHLGKLQPYKGTPMADEGTPYVSQAQLMAPHYSETAVVLHIGFSGHDESDFKVKSVHAYLRGTSM